MIRVFLRLAPPAILAATAQPGLSQTYTVNGVSPITAYGEVAAAVSGNTVFAQNNTTVTVQSGGGARIKGTVRRATVTIRCAGSGSPNTCTVAGNRARIRVGALSSTGRAGTFQEFIATGGTGTISGTTTGSLLDFTMTGWTGTGNLTFFLDTKLPVAGDDTGGATGAQTSTYYVYVAKDPTIPTTGSTVAATITIRRPLQMVKNSDLNFGTLVRQPSGASASVVINNSTGIRTQTGNANLIALPSPSPSRAQFTITGEPSTTFAISYSPTGNIIMSNGASTLSVTTSKTATGNQTMPASGTLTLGVGGTISVLSTTARGQYSGTLTVTTTYN
ncbi:DUF4402 domain-containing protein [Rhizorhabdus phycosphaerae]|uniref:DUF4402 domain-containing protein n=1 Tax=Rhizorhabdus phycosphaerae TaxID=2711156 RepID=UPI0013EC656D|nr:DUF4402 domain-containing protein [Rhizorhabdus phycosphaerae]